MSQNDHVIDLTRLPIGALALFRGTELERSDLDLLHALGLTEGSRIRVCQTGDPWIVQVRSTRIGIAEAVARHILVLPENSHEPAGKNPDPSEKNQESLGDGRELRGVNR
jgi:hypothetical protein